MSEFDTLTRLKEMELTILVNLDKSNHLKGLHMLEDVGVALITPRIRDWCITKVVKSLSLFERILSHFWNKYFFTLKCSIVVHELSLMNYCDVDFECCAGVHSCS